MVGAAEAEVEIEALGSLLDDRIGVGIYVVGVMTSWVEGEQFWRCD